jgi:glutamate synthase (NADH) small subunit (EC 1.4.1.14)
VVVIGGGDTGADCVGVAHRQGAACVVQIEVMPRPAQCRTDDFPWPRYPLLLKSSTSHIEGGERQWAVLTKRFNGKNGAIESLECVRVEFQRSGAAACPLMKEVAGSEFSIDADLIILAVGFIHPEHPGLLADLGIAFDQRGNVKTDQCYMSSRKGFFAAGDLRRGQSLIVWAISEGRKAAHYIDAYVMGKPSTLPLGCSFYLLNGKVKDTISSVVEIRGRSSKRGIYVKSRFFSGAGNAPELEKQTKGVF